MSGHSLEPVHGDDDDDEETVVSKMATRSSFDAALAWAVQQVESYKIEAPYVAIVPVMTLGEYGEDIKVMFRVNVQGYL
jgi:hypothetical protein